LEKALEDVPITYSKRGGKNNGINKKKRGGQETRRDERLVSRGQSERERNPDTSGHARSIGVKLVFLKTNVTKGGKTARGGGKGKTKGVDLGVDGGRTREGGKIGQS